MQNQRVLSSFSAKKNLALRGEEIIPALRESLIYFSMASLSLLEREIRAATTRDQFNNRMSSVEEETANSVLKTCLRL